MTLTCPKCAGEMRSYERNRVLVDQCTGCGGLFLDKGELEQLAAAENAWHQRETAAPPPAAPQHPAQDTPRYQQPAHGQPSYGPPAYDPRYLQRDRYDSDRGSHYRPKKRKSFLSELFDD